MLHILIVAGQPERNDVSRHVGLRQQSQYRGEGQMAGRIVAVGKDHEAPDRIGWQPRHCLYSSRYAVVERRISAGVHPGKRRRQRRTVGRRCQDKRWRGREGDESYPNISRQLARVADRGLLCAGEACSAH